MLLVQFIIYIYEFSLFLWFSLNWMDIMIYMLLHRLLFTLPKYSMILCIPSHVVSNNFLSFAIVICPWRARVMKIYRHYFYISILIIIGLHTHFQLHFSSINIKTLLLQFGPHFISWDTVLLRLLLTTMHWEIANVYSGRTARRVMGFERYSFLSDRVSF